MIGSLVLGGIQLAGGLAAALSMGRRPRFSEDPRFTDAASRAEYMATFGFTPQERAAFQGDIAAQTAGDYRRGIDMAGGNMSRALGGISTARTLGAFNRFASQDAALRRQNIQYADQFSRERQRRADMQTRADIQQYDAEQQAVGKAIQTGLTGLGNVGNFATSMNFQQNLANENIQGDLEKLSSELSGLSGSNLTPEQQARKASLMEYKDALKKYGSGGFFGRAFGSYPMYPVE